MSSKPIELRIGDPVWKFDSNRRRYSAPAKGRLYGEIIWREHWAPYEVIGETARSWLIGHARGGGPPYIVAKLPKSGKFTATLAREAFCLSEAEIDERVWVHDHRMVIVNKVERCYDADILRTIEALVDAGPD